MVCAAWQWLQTDATQIVHICCNQLSLTPAALKSQNMLETKSLEDYASHGWCPELVGREWLEATWPASQNPQFQTGRPSGREHSWLFYSNRQLQTKASGSQGSDNARAICKTTLRPFRKNGDVSPCIWICSDINRLHKQGWLQLFLYRERQLKIFFLNKSIMAQREKVLQGRCPERCFGSSLMGHQIRQSPNRRVNPGANKEPGLCQRCDKKKTLDKQRPIKEIAQQNPLLGNKQRGPHVWKRIG